MGGGHNIRADDNDSNTLCILANQFTPKYAKTFLTNHDSHI